MELVTSVYKCTNQFPSSEIYGLTSQMRRAAISIPCNVAEGYRRKGENEFRHFLKIAFGSAAELETQVEIAKNLGYISVETFGEIEVCLTEVMKLLNKMTE